MASNGAGDLFDGAQTADGGGLGLLLVVVGGIAVLVDEELLVQGGNHIARADAVNGDVLPAEVVGQGAGRDRQPALDAP